MYPIYVVIEINIVDNFKIKLNGRNIKAFNIYFSGRR